MPEATRSFTLLCFGSRAEDVPQMESPGNEGQTLSSMQSGWRTKKKTYWPQQETGASIDPEHDHWPPWQNTENVNNWRQCPASKVCTVCKAQRGFANVVQKGQSIRCQHWWKSPQGEDRHALPLVTENFGTHGSWLHQCRVRHGHMYSSGAPCSFVQWFCCTIFAYFGWYKFRVIWMFFWTHKIHIIKILLYSLAKYFQWTQNVSAFLLRTLAGGCKFKITKKQTVALYSSVWACKYCLCNGTHNPRALE